jgi:hypothetical protein
MSLKYLTRDEMVGITATWIDRGHADRRTLARIPSVGGLLPLVEEAHLELASMPDSDTDQGPTDLSAALLAMDLRHDSYVRVTYYALDAHIHLAVAQGMDEEASSLEKLRNKLLPDGLRLVDYSYDEESSQAKLLESRLSTPDRAVLTNIPIRDGNLMHTVDAWLRSGRELGEMQAQHEQSQREQPAAVDEAIRNKWIRAVKTVRMVLKLISSDEPGVRPILDNIDRVEREADARTRDGYVREGALPTE